MPKKNARLLLTTGDPNGIGPEIILKIFQNVSFSSKFDLSVVGSKSVLDYYSSLLNLIKIPPESVLDISVPRGYDVKPGKIDGKAGKLAGNSIRMAVELCLLNEYDGIITLPISKESLNMGGFKYPGHTEMLSELTDSANTIMILYSKEISVGLITGHLPVCEIRNKLNKELISGKIIALNNSCVTDFKIKNPKIALLSLNPHSGDGGLLGSEEENILKPIIIKMNSLGFNIRGPYAADSYFATKLYEKFDITMAMYHDQGLIPFKMLSFDKGVNFTAGLKIVRTSPDHGTAFDIAGMGKANSRSTEEAVKLANAIVLRKYQQVLDVKC